MDEWKEGIWLGVSAFLAAMLITFAVVLGSVSQSVARMQQKDINIITEMEEYRKWVKYDDVIATQADVISCILENGSNSPAVIVSKDISYDIPAGPFVLDNDTKSFTDPNFWNAECGNHIVSIDNKAISQDDFIMKHTWNDSSVNPDYQNIGNIRSYFLWNGANPQYAQPNSKLPPNQNDYALEALYNYILPESTYRANLVKDANGEVVYIWFRRIS